MAQEESTTILADQVNNLAFIVGKLEKTVTTLTEVLTEISGKLDGLNVSRPEK